VLGLARGFLSAGAAAAVVSLWSVEDGSTASLMEHMYTQIAQGNTVP
jgi:CHAT domain-containing protein